MKEFRCKYCNGHYETKFPNEVKFCSLPCSDLQKGKEMAEEWIKAEKKYSPSEIKKINKKKRDIARKWASKSLSTYYSSNICRG